MAEVPSSKAEESIVIPMNDRGTAVQSKAEFRREERSNTIAYVYELPPKRALLSRELQDNLLDILPITAEEGRVRVVRERVVVKDEQGRHVRVNGQQVLRLARVKVEVFLTQDEENRVGQAVRDRLRPFTEV